jgi:glycosyltransferase involved in cell wall biosynthesis
MDVGIYNGRASPNAIGEVEFYAAVLAADLRRSHRVEIVNHSPYFTIENLALGAGLDLGGVQHRYLPRDTATGPNTLNPWQRYREAWSWGAKISERYDLFINLTCDVPPFCHAPRGVLVVLFPCAMPAGQGPARAGNSSLRLRARRAYHTWEWQRRLATYQLKASISQFTGAWARRWWRLDCPVLYPPCNNQPVDAVKRNSIVSVGRLSTGRHTQGQSEMLRIFGELRSRGLEGLEHACVTGIDESSPDDLVYHDQLRELGASVGAQVLANAGRPELRALFARSKVCWHAAGVGEDEHTHPELAEHFGLDIVEAMAAGCVPIAINRGGPAEIIRHGRDGFLCDTLEEFCGHTWRLLEDEPRYREMAGAARRRAAEFSQDQFLQRWKVLLGATFSDWWSVVPRTSSAEQTLCPTPEEKLRSHTAA